MVVYCVCTLIFDLIVNTIVTKIVNATNTPYSVSILSSLVTASTNSEISPLVVTVDIVQSVSSDSRQTDHSLNAIDIEEIQEILVVQGRKSNSFIERGSFAEGIIATLFKQPN
jgi:hypothetical protein